uniref:Lipopolysaccharide-induced tumor necrosis factor-alpha factor homolog n=1 Tax=Fundulus heteroclitus TaxID=8078 RepID=A0A3Q2Q6J8_FUNHE
MEPPSYEEASRHLSVQLAGDPTQPSPPSYTSGQAPSVVVVSQPQPVPIQVASLRDSPGFVRCPHCQQLVTSNVKYVAGSSAWCTCVILGMLGLICGFCLIPLCMKSMQDAHHSCPNCGKKLHIYER